MRRSDSGRTRTARNHIINFTVLLRIIHAYVVLYNERNITVCCKFIQRSGYFKFLPYSQWCTGIVSAVVVNVRDAGEGTLEISICGPSGQNISNSVTTLGPGHFLVSYIPLEAGPHRANVTFNGESVCGMPCVILV